MSTAHMCPAKYVCNMVVMNLSELIINLVLSFFIFRRCNTTLTATHLAATSTNTLLDKLHIERTHYWHALLMAMQIVHYIIDIVIREFSN